MYQTILYELKGNIAKITLNRPKEGNAFNAEMFQEVLSAIEQIDGDSAVRAVVITGQGKHFSTGGDIGEMEKRTLITAATVSTAGKMSGAVRRCSKPVVAMINGMAAGAGCSLALACDFRIMTEKSALMTAFINMGVSGDTGAIYHLYHTVGLAKTLELMALGAPVYGWEAQRLGLATKLVEVDSLEAETEAFAGLLSQKATAALARQKQIYNEIFCYDYDQFCQLEARMMLESAGTDDHLEAVTAFLEKRSPHFKGM